MIPVKPSLSTPKMNANLSDTYGKNFKSEVTTLSADGPNSVSVSV